ncbi:MAG: hypothetical protein MJD61_03210 [Proteobacteria bacterium]|nr:hypothetical protein [Pseudomonadota bacterium]
MEQQQGPDDLVARLRSNPDDVGAFAALRQSYERHGQFASLVNLMDGWAARRKDPREAASASFEAAEIALAHLKDTQRAETLLRRTLTHYPGHAQALARLQALSGGQPKRLAEFLAGLLEQASGDDQSLALTHYTLAGAYKQAGALGLQTGANQLALQHYARAYELDPTMLAAMYEAREIRMAQQDWPDAVALCDREAGAEKDQDRKAALYGEAARMKDEQLNDTKAAIDGLRQALKEVPSDPKLQHQLATCLLKWADAQQHPTHMQPQAHTEPQSGPNKAREEAAELFYEIAGGVPDEQATQYASTALSYAPGHEQALSLLELIAVRNKNEAMLPPYWVAFLQVKPGGREADRRRARLGQAYLEAGQLQDARVCFEYLASKGSKKARQALQEIEERLQNAGESLQAPAGGTEIPQPAAPQPTLRTGDPPDAEETTSPRVVAPSKPAQALTGPGAEPVSTAAGGEIETLRAELRQLLQENRREDAADRCTRILELRPDDAETFDQLAAYLTEQGDYMRLRALLVDSAANADLPLDVRRARLRQAAVLSEERLGDSAAALEAWDALLALQPQDAEADSEVERLLRAQARWDDLVALLERRTRATKERREQAELYGRIGALHREQRQDLGQASAAYAKANELAPSQDTRQALSATLVAAGQHAEAIPLIRHALEVEADPEARTRLLRELIELLDATGQAESEDAADALAMLADLVPGDMFIAERLEALDEQHGRYDRLLASLERRRAALAESEQVAVLRRMAFVAQSQLGDSLAAAGYLRQACDLAPHDAGVFGELAELLDTRGDFSELAKLLEARARAETVVRSRTELLRRLARVLAERLGDENAAAATWRELLELQEDDEALRALRARATKADDIVVLEDALRRLAELSQQPQEKRDLLMERARLLGQRMDCAADAIGVLAQIVTDLQSDFLPAVELWAQLSEEIGDTEQLGRALSHELEALHEPSKKLAVAKRLAALYEDEQPDSEASLHALREWAKADPSDPVPLQRLRTKLEEAERWQDLLEVLDRLADTQTEAEERDEAARDAAELAYEKLQDVGAAWKRLVPLVRRGDELAEESLRALAFAGERFEGLAGVYIKLAQASQDATQQARRWGQVADLYEEQLGDSKQALEAALRELAADLSSEAALARVERLTAAAGAWPRLHQVYDRLAKAAPGNEQRLALLLRHIQLLESSNKALEAFERMVTATSLAPGDEGLLERLETLAQQSDRREELSRVYARRTEQTQDSETKKKLMLRGAELCQKLGSYEEAAASLAEAVQLTPRAPELVAVLEEAAHRFDQEGPEQLRQTARRGLVKAYRALADEASAGDFAVQLLLRASNLLRSELDDPHEALDILRHATSLFPNDEQALDELEEIAKLGDHLDALDVHLGRLVDAAIDSETAVLLLRRRARVLEEDLQRHEEAADVYAKLLQIRPDDDEAPDHLFGCLRSAGRYQELLVAIDQRLQHAGDDEEKLRLLKDVAHIWEHRLKNRWEALDAWNKVAAHDAGDEEAKEAIERLQRATHPPPPDEEALFADTGLLRAPKVPDIGQLGEAPLENDTVTMVARTPEALVRAARADTPFAPGEGTPVNEAGGPDSDNPDAERADKLRLRTPHAGAGHGIAEANETRAQLQELIDSIAPDAPQDAPSRPGHSERNKAGSGEPEGPNRDDH